MNYYFTSESVSEGHPDKICDQISDAVVDKALETDPYSRVAIETFIKDDLIVIGGEITTEAKIDYEAIARETLTEIGYTKKEYGIDANTCEIITKINKQSQDIARGVNTNKAINKKLGAGDQGMVFGFACKQTPELMPPPPIVLSHQLVKKLTEKRKKGTLPYLRPDGKSQITVEYSPNKEILRINTVVLSTQHAPEISLETLQEDILKQVIEETLPSHLIDEKTRFHLNPAGPFVTGGPKADSGLTGRKIIVDTYGGWARHGGGCFSGKDPSKIDRSGAYMARYIAKNIVASNLADELEIQIGYAIGKSKPVSLYLQTNNTAKIKEEEIINIINASFDLTPEGMIETLDLLKQKYKPTATYGHFGRNDINLSWEKLNKASEIIEKKNKILV